ncbi:hypothetical protein BDV96DRAFT_592770 [Lophiotrema nucula]|uniref:Uncharacterized protein n=1 Tax=Lophiotrema nucula TaxID=690887 RepID=A0A6A5YGF9_9PLEO|nr:hypothetical protein BDV96DRAFT_592770 [Lophiotrema nucula]
MTTILLPQIFVPVESIKLGRLVTSVYHPHQDYDDPSFSPALVPTINIRARYGKELKDRPTTWHNNNCSTAPCEAFLSQYFTSKVTPPAKKHLIMLEIT